MNENEVIGTYLKLMRCFPGSFINHNMEFVAHLEANQFFRLDDCASEFDIKCKVLEWFSRGAYKTAPFGERKNKRLHEFMLRGINDYLGTDFTEDDMENIYTRLGNRCNHELTVRFIESGYDMRLLREPKER